MLIDTHAHLEYGELVGSSDAIIKRAQESGVDRMISISCHPEGCEETRNLAERFPGVVFTAFGLHPHDAGDATATSINLIEPFLATQGVVAVGECGLDYSRLDRSTQKSTDDLGGEISEERERQRALTIAHIRLANSFRLPVIFHVRDAHQDMHALLAEVMPEQGGVIHSFTGTTEEAAWYLNHGFIFGINGIITFKKSDSLRNVVRSLPLTSIVLETDAPFLAPEPYRGKTNEPSLIVETARMLSQLFDCSLDEIERQTTENAERLFSLSAKRS